MNDKLNELVISEGMEDLLEFLEAFGHDTVVPGICTNDGCSYTNEVEPDCTDGWCEECSTNTVKSGVVLAGMI